MYMNVIGRNCARIDLNPLPLACVLQVRAGILKKRIKRNRMEARQEGALEESLKLLRGESDEHKFAGLCVASKYLKATDQESALEIGSKIVDAAGSDFLVRLIATEPLTSSTEGMVCRTT